jgi:hypothetical protein
LQKRLQRLHLKTEKGVELTVTETAKDPLSGLELHRHLTQGDRQGGEDLSWIAFSDATVCQSRESEDSISQTLGCDRDDAKAGASIGEVVDHIRTDPQLFATTELSFRATAFGFRLRARLRAADLGEIVDERPQTIATGLELTPRRQFWPFEQVLRLVAGVRNFPVSHHPARALEGVQLAPELG